MYKNVSFLRSTKSDPLPQLHRAIDWVESKGLLTRPCTVVFRPRMKNTDIMAQYMYKTQRVMLYRAEPIRMELGLVHELIHHHQWDGENFRANPGFKTDIPGSGKRERYLTIDDELEAWWYTNEYSKYMFGRPHEIEDEYLELGIHLSQLSPE